MANLSFGCPEEGCPEGVGRLFAINFQNANASHVCSAFLISSTLVMTNSHCLYFEGVNDTKVCSGVHLAFPNKWGYYYSSECRKIIWKDNQLSGSPYYQEGDRDFALIELKSEIPLPFLKINPVGLGPQDDAYPLVVDHLSRNHAQILKLSCRVNSVRKSDGLMELAGCPVISGNSGAAVLDGQGEVGGVLFASNDASVRSPGVLEKKKYSTRAYAYNMSYVLDVLEKFMNQAALTGWLTVQ
jgi:V8-like Glu-specific endopeptidase